MTTNGNPGQRSATKERTASLRRRAGGLSLGVLLASFAAVAAGAGPDWSSGTAAPLPPEAVQQSPTATAARPSTPAMSRTAPPLQVAPAAPAVQARPAPTPAPQQRAQPARRARSRQS